MMATSSLQPLMPTALDAQSLQRVRSGRIFARLALVSILIFMIVVACLFVPWQQVVVGVGKVSVYSPQDRPQTIQAQISARIDRWLVRDGQTVRQGDVLVTLRETDTKYLDPNQLERMLKQRQALQQRLAAANTRVNTISRQQQMVENSQQNAVPAAGERLRQTRDRLNQANQSLIAAQQNVQTTRYNLTRIRELNDQGLRSRRDRELADLENVRATTELERAKAALSVAQRDVSVGQLDQGRIQADTSASVFSVGASLASAQETVAGLMNDVNKLDIDIQNMQQRMTQRTVKAPVSGRIVRVNTIGQGETVSEGDALATIVPDTADQAVELTMSDNDIPLVRLGSPVRLQFAGWPAIQFTGWPAASVGTFAGHVAAIDAVDDGKSRFRLIVVPDKEKIASGKETSWPSNQVLRPGSKVIGWVMLQTVPLWFELWRQFNGFPPNFPQEDGTGTIEDGGKKAAGSDDKKADAKATKRKAKTK
jgi:membrane fusion protein, adhesin transport system